jgi:hypothetical protein
VQYRIPLQTNGVDCGLFSVECAEQLLAKPPSRDDVLHVLRAARPMPQPPAAPAAPPTQLVSATLAHAIGRGAGGAGALRQDDVCANIWLNALDVAEEVGGSGGASQCAAADAAVSGLSDRGADGHSGMLGDDLDEFGNQLRLRRQSEDLAAAAAGAAGGATRALLPPQPQPQATQPIDLDAEHDGALIDADVEAAPQPPPPHAWTYDASDWFDARALERDKRTHVQETIARLRDVAAAHEASAVS